jgi:hypothetical protein
MANRAQDNVLVSEPMPLVGVVMPVLNEANFIAGCLQS